MIIKSEDPHLALLLCRSTPLENGYTSPELLIGRKLCLTLLLTPEKLTPKLLTLNRCRRLREHTNFDKVKITIIAIRHQYFLNEIQVTKFGYQARVPQQWRFKTPHSPGHILLRQSSVFYVRIEDIWSQTRGRKSRKLQSLSQLEMSRQQWRQDPQLALTLPAMCLRLVRVELSFHILDSICKVALAV